MIVHRCPIVRFMFRIVQKIDPDPATACRFCHDTGLDMQREDQVARCGSGLRDLKVETSGLYVSVTHRIFT